MGLEQKLNLKLSQRLVMTPSLQQAIKLLQMSKLELQEVLTQEMVENPVLEEEQEEAEETVRETETAEAPAAESAREEPAPAATAAAPGDAEVEKALALVRSLDPPGICAFDLPDCLMLQIRVLGIENPLIEKIVTAHWPEFLNRQFQQLSRTLGVGMSELQAVVEIIKNLEPKPGRKYSNERTIYVEPDVAVRKIGDEYVIQLNEDGLPKLRISAAYRRMLRGGNGAIGEEAATYLKDKMRSAVWLIKSLDQRQRTIYKVADSIVRHQREFLENGIEHLRPLVLRDVANDIGMDESTVSRVVSNKYIHTPRGLFPMKYFFHSGIDSTQGSEVSSLSIKSKIAKIVSDEDTARPHSDARIMQKLRAEGIQIPRRTVAKYREELRIPSSSQRKQSF